MEFKTFGPYILPRKNKNILINSAEERREFTELVEKDAPELTLACGCYIFCIQSPRGSLPWYIGKAEKQSFAKECLSPHKILNYNSITATRKGIPVLYFLAQVTPKGKFRKPTVGKRPAIGALEEMLIGMAIARNGDLLNIKGTKMLRELKIHGIFNSQRKDRSGPGADLRKILQLD